MLCVPYTLNSMTPNEEIFRCFLSKILKDDISTDLGNQCFKTSSCILLTMVNSLLLNSALLEIRTPTLLLIVHMQVHYWTKIGIHLILPTPLTFCGIHLQLRNPEQLAVFACCGIRNKTSMPTKFTLRVSTEILFVESSYISEYNLRIVSGIQEYTDTKLCS